MPKWTKPSEAHPECEVGDRLVCIALERKHARAKILPRVVVMEATEDGWTTDDSQYIGYSLDDFALWTLESDLGAIALEVCIVED